MMYRIYEYSNGVKHWRNPNDGSSMLSLCRKGDYLDWPAYVDINSPCDKVCQTCEMWYVLEMMK